MKTEAAITFNNRLKEIYQVLEAAYHGKLEELFPEFSNDKRFNDFNTINLEYNFRDEVAENMKTYHNETYIKDYIELYIDIDYLRRIHDLTSFNKTILKNGIEVRRILNLKGHYDRFLESLEKLEDPNNKYIKEFISYSTIILPTDEYSEVLEKFYSEDSVFGVYNFTNVKATADTIENYLERIKYLVKMQYKYKQWELEADVEFKEEIKNIYPNYEQNCSLEIERIERLIELDKKYGKPQEASNKETANTPNTSEYQWNGSDIDLIELLTSVQELGLITKKGSKNTSRKELIGIFENLFGLTIKDPESKLSKTIYRKKGEPNILERLVNAYYDYNSKKLAKASKR